MPPFFEVIFMSTIAAIATPDAVGGLSVIRISGKSAFIIADKSFKSLNKNKVFDMKGYTCSYGYIIDENDNIIDDVILTVFRNPKSYTGEDVVEISCHGGRFITKKILRTILKNGAKPAEAGEFTKRAFLNGKLSLTQAEAVMDVISSAGENQLKYANALKNGSIFKRITKIKNDLIEILSGLAAWADFPEEDVPEVDPQTLKSQIDIITNELNLLLSTYDHGRIVREGINTVICGKPNVGKSSLMNSLIGFQRSIVTDIEGTTRDVIEESVRVGDYILRLSDTAGLRKTDDIIESMGVDIAYQKIDEADLIIAVFDSNSHLSNEEIELISHIKNKKCIAIINKIDKDCKIDKNSLYSSFKYVIEISAKNNWGTDKIEDILNEIFLLDKTEADDGIIANERQKNCIENSLKNLNDAKFILENGETLDAVTVMIDSAVDDLLELTGEKISDVVIDEVFSRFCVGK